MDSACRGGSETDGPSRSQSLSRTDQATRTARARAAGPAFGTGPRPPSGAAPNRFSLTARLQLHTPAGRAMPRGGPDERRQEVLSAMKSPSAAATRTLIGALGDADPLVREWAIEALSRRKDRSAAVKELLERLQDDRADVRWYAARALGKLGGADDAVRRALTDALTDPDEYVRCFAAWALGVLGMRDAIPDLRK